MSLSLASTVRPVSASTDWVLLAYRLPREPSSPRISVWRKLKRLGVAQLLDGLVALPSDARTREHLDWIADEIVTAGGTATLWTGRPIGAKNERQIIAAMTAAVAADYHAIIDAAAVARDMDEADRRRSLARLQREYQRIAARDYFACRERDRALRAVRGLARLVEAVA